MRHRAATIPMAQWRRVLVCVEGASQDAATELDILSFASGEIVRDATTRAIDVYSGPRTPFGWPPDDYGVTVALQDQEWSWVLRQLELWGAGDDFDEVETAKVLLDALGDPPPVAAGSTP